MAECIFCDRGKLEIIAENKLALAFYDNCPVSKGHALIIPKRHIETFFDAGSREQAAISSLAGAVREILDRLHQPDGYNIGTNVGPAAGQTVFHYHLHIIPRYRGDVADPRGGVRKVIPSHSCHRVITAGDLQPQPG